MMSISYSAIFPNLKIDGNDEILEKVQFQMITYLNYICPKNVFKVTTMAIIR